MDIADAGMLGGGVACALGLFKIIEALVAKLGGGGNGNGKVCFILEQLNAGQREMLTEQRVTNEILRGTQRDHGEMNKQLERIEKVKAE